MSKLNDLLEYRCITCHHVHFPLESKLFFVNLLNENMERNSCKIMGHIKEPKGVDFIIQSRPLTDKDRKEISKHIADYKAKHKKKQTINQKSKEPV